jgi:hypothetical protein
MMWLIGYDAKEDSACMQAEKSGKIKETVSFEIRSAQ